MNFRELIRKARSFSRNEKALAIYYVIIYFINNFTEYYIQVFPKPLFAIAYVWTLYIYCWNTFVTRKYWKKPYFLAAQMFLGINVVFTYIHKENWRMSSLPDFALLILYIFVCFGAFFSEDHEKDRYGLEKLLHAFVILTFTMSLLSDIGYWIPLPFIGRDMADRWRGLYAMVAETGFYAYFSGIVSLYFVHNKLIAGRKMNKLLFWLHVLNLPVQMLLLVLAKGRTTMACFGVGVMIVVFHDLNALARKDKKFRFLPALMVVVFALIAYVVVFTDLVSSRNLSSLVGNTGTIAAMTEAEKTAYLDDITTDRYTLWVTSIEMFKKSPFIGYGLKSYGFTYYKPVPKSNSHNIFITTLLYTGVIGTASLVSYLLICVRGMHRHKNSATIGLIALCISFFLTSMLEISFLYNGKAVTAIHWMVLGWLCSCTNESESERQDA
ncbi:MAG: O-antigen ligase family protein [Bulleidia sp.]|nr:O-antigen ligase family protein [Bulleidia sp.]